MAVRFRVTSATRPNAFYSHFVPVSRSAMTVRDRQDLNSRLLFPVDDPVRKLPQHKFSRSL